MYLFFNHIIITMKEQSSSFIDINDGRYALEESNTDIHWLNKFNNPDYVLNNSSQETDSISPLRIGLAAVALIAIPTGQFSLNNINNERYELRESIEDMNLALPAEYIVQSEDQLEAATQWIEQEEKRLIEELEESSSLRDKGNLALTTAISGWLSLLAMNSYTFFKRKK